MTIYKREYQAFHDAKQRCNNPKHKRYADWGGRGIQVEFNSFQEFLDCLGPRPNGLSLDRIDNDANYRVGNVRWSTRSQQQLNKRVKGVRQVKSKGLITETWQSYVHIDGKFHQLYTGPSYDEAVQAREIKMKELNETTKK